MCLCMYGETDKTCPKFLWNCFSDVNLKFENILKSYYKYRLEMLKSHIKHKLNDKLKLAIYTLVENTENFCSILNMLRPTWTIF
jgi:hypothetical protein